MTAQTPEALASEGAAQLALEVALGPKPYEVVAEVLTGIGLPFDPEEAHAVGEAELELYAVSVNAAFMIHEAGVPLDEVGDYVRTWALESDEKAAQTVRHAADPSARAYIPAYPEGLRLAAPSWNERRGTSRACLPSSSPPPTWPRELSHLARGPRYRSVSRSKPTSTAPAGPIAPLRFV